ncbi:hypothetical protein [Burkholderia sp. Ax-1724]|uniref:hypothetical protein n=1 Tax=Burkholderia sp. Ax-1724 TaxID=2608336 RepID=UPI0014240133|nr:hypothetical protein [Burkholderia sp. Ax-1724]NIF56687.1 hypothetical protein [Burkholderia sp. Ax-1724]
MRIADETIFITVDAQKVAAVAHEGRHTSRRQLSILAKHLREKFDIDVQISVSSDEANVRVEGLLRDLFERQFPGTVSDVTASLRDLETASVWIDAENVSDMDTVIAIEAATHATLSSLALHRSEVHVQAPIVEEPTNVAILSAVKLLSPVNLSNLKQYLDRDFHLPSESWLASKLDLMRKKGFTLRDRDGYFHLTESGLSVVPISRRRNSSDVSRALLLVKRKWA